MDVGRNRRDGWKEMEGGRENDDEVRREERDKGEGRGGNRGGLHRGWSAVRSDRTGADVKKSLLPTPTCARGRGDKITSLSLQHRPKKYVGEVS